MFNVSRPLASSLMRRSLMLRWWVNVVGAPSQTDKQSRTRFVRSTFLMMFTFLFLWCFCLWLNVVFHYKQTIYCRLSLNRPFLFSYFPLLRLPSQAHPVGFSFFNFTGFLAIFKVVPSTTTMVFYLLGPRIVDMMGL